jgi:hypothetical protein
MYKALHVIFLLLASTLIAFGQSECEPDLVYAVIAPSGLKIRAEPSTKGKHITTVPYDSLVIACPETFGYFKTKDTKGYWRFVKYKEHAGYMYDGFLLPRNRVVNNRKALENNDSSSVGESNSEILEIAPAPPVDFTLATETYNYCGEVDEIDQSIQWYGIYPPTPGSSGYSMERVSVEVLLSKHKMSSNMEFDIRTDREEKSIFLIGSGNPLNRGTVLYLTQAMQEALPLSLYPGQNSTLFARSATESPKNIDMLSLGSVTAGGDCPVLTDFKLLATTKLGQENIEQDIAPLVRIDSACGVPELLWFGDINGDEYADALWASRNETDSQFSLLVSQLGEENIWVLSDTWIIKSCEE